MAIYNALKARRMNKQEDPPRKEGIMAQGQLISKLSLSLTGRGSRRHGLLHICHWVNVGTRVTIAEKIIIENEQRLAKDGA